jgi:hypothetical protein
MLMPAPSDAASPTRNASQLFKYRGERGNRSVHESRQARLDDLQHEEPTLCFLFFLFLAAAQLFAAQFLCPVGVIALLLRQIIQQLPHSGIPRARRGPLVEAARFHLHGAGLLGHCVQPQGLQQPYRPPLDEPANVLPADQWNMLTEFGAEQLNQPAAVPGLFLAHALKDLGSLRKILPESFGQIRIDALIFLFESDGQRQNFSFREAVKILHHDLQMISSPPELPGAPRLPRRYD